MVEIGESQALVEKKHFLLRKLNRKDVEGKLEIEQEIARLDNAIFEILQKRLKQESEALKIKIQTINSTIYEDGKFKRAVATLMIDFLKEQLSESEIKGVSRAIYKKIRGQ